MLTRFAGEPVGSRRRYLMCRPDEFDVVYRINPWMHPGQAVDARRATTQWQALRDTLESLGHDVQVIEPAPGLPDMVFAANAAVVIGDRAVAARMAVAQRRGEERFYRRWLASHGIADLRIASHLSEGEGDFVRVDGSALAGAGFRTTHAAHRELAAAFGLDVTTLHLADARWYHLDMALVALDDRIIAYYPGAFRPWSQRLLAERFPDAILATSDDALAFGLNAISDGRHVLIPHGARDLARAIAAKGYDVIPVNVSEFHRAGGSAKCCVLELHPPRALT
jgi:N-dimethylarginine dimethylaminohydrolase